MSFSTTESFASVKALDTQNEHQDFSDHIKKDLATCYFIACAEADMQAPASWAPLTEYRNMALSKHPIRREQTVGEILVASLDYPNGPKMQDAIELICRAASGENIELNSIKLLANMANSWIYYHKELL